MKVNISGVCIETRKIVVYLKSPWRANALEHKLFEAARQIPEVQVEESQAEYKIVLKNIEKFQTLLESCTRILKGWQEDADLGTERRFWCWLFEGDADASGYDHNGNPASIWIFVRAIIEHAEHSMDAPKVEHVDLESFNFELTNNEFSR